MDRYLIINADDFGISRSVNTAIISLLKEKRISSATLMPNARFYKEAAEWSAKNSENVGLHLSLVNDNCNLKNYSISGRRSLLDQSGYLYDDMNSFRKCTKMKDLKEEIRLQFKKISDDGIKISHVDSHRYAIYPAYRPFLFIFLLKMCNKYNKVPTRWCRNGSYSIAGGVKSLCESDNAAGFFASFCDYYRIPIPDYVFKFPYRDVFVSYEDKKKAFMEMLYNLPAGISEVHIHPAIETDELKETNPTWEERVSEYKLMFDEKVIEAVNKLGIQIITYRDIRKINDNMSIISSSCNIIYNAMRYSLKNVRRASKLGQ